MLLLKRLPQKDKTKAKNKRKSTTEGKESKGLQQKEEDKERTLCYSSSFSHDALLIPHKTALFLQLVTLLLAA